MFITLRHKKDLAPLNDPIDGVSGGSVPNNQTDQPSLPGDPPLVEGGDDTSSNISWCKIAC